LDHGKETDHFRIGAVKLADATGNIWRTELNQFRQAEFNSASNSIVEVAGALWRDEDAWNIEVEILRTDGFPEDEVIKLSNMPMPEPKSFVELRGETNGLPSSIPMVILLAPSTLAQGNQSWAWRRDDGFTVGLRLKADAGGKLLEVISAQNQNGDQLKLLFQTAPDGFGRALVFEPLPGTTSINLKLALPEIRKFEFIARPEFVK
jgi:hypothetical protein